MSTDPSSLDILTNEIGGEIDHNTEEKEHDDKDEGSEADKDDGE